MLRKILNSKVQSSKSFKIKLKVGDEVMVRSGAQRGRSGKVVQVHPHLNKVTVEGINIVKKHVKPNRVYPKGAIVEKTVPIWVHKVGIIHPTDKTRTSRIGYQFGKDGKKIRVYRGANNQEITTPKPSKQNDEGKK